MMYVTLMVVVVVVTMTMMTMMTMMTLMTMVMIMIASRYMLSAPPTTAPPGVCVCLCVGGEGYATSGGAQALTSSVDAPARGGAGEVTGQSPY